MGNLAILFEHTQRFVREVMADRLREEGFVSYKGEDIHWYRIVNNEVIHAVYFTTRHTVLDSFFDICYGCHPLYIPPVFQKSPYLQEQCCFEQMSDRIPELIPGSTFHGFHGTCLYGLYNRQYRVPDVRIFCPTDKNNGLDILEQVFQGMEKLKTPRACYEMHKWRREGAIECETMFAMSPYFVDEVLYWEDTDLYPYCQKYIEETIDRFNFWQKRGVRIRKNYHEEFEGCMQLQKVFEEGSRQEYIATFQKRAEETLKKLEKHTAIRKNI